MPHHTPIFFEKNTYDQTAPCPILHDLGRHHGISHQRPKERRHHTGMYSRKDDKSRAPLGQHAGGSQELQGQADGIHNQEGSELYSAYGGFTAVGEVNEEEDKEE